MVTQTIYCLAELKTYKLYETDVVVSCWPEIYRLQIWSEKILMFDCGIFILSYLMPSASEIICICHFSHGFYDGRLELCAQVPVHSRTGTLRFQRSLQGYCGGSNSILKCYLFLHLCQNVWWELEKACMVDRVFYRILTGIKEMCLLNLNYFISATVLMKTIQRWLHPASVLQTNGHMSFNHLCTTEVYLVMW